jgi:hypothetical protein
MVPVHDRVPVRVLRGAADLPEQVNPGVQRQRALTTERRQRRALDVLHHQRREARTRDPGVEQADDERVAERRQNLAPGLDTSRRDVADIAQPQPDEDVRAMPRHQLGGRPDVDQASMVDDGHPVAQPLGFPYALAFAAGAMIFVVVEEVIPESQEGGNGDLATLGTMVGFAVMMTLDVALG